MEKNIQNEENFIIKPRLQIEQNGLEYIEADKGYLNKDQYLFKNVIMNSTFGNITSGLLEITEDQNILIFTKNPKFILYINKKN